MNCLSHHCLSQPTLRPPCFISHALLVLATLASHHSMSSNCSRSSTEYSSPLCIPTPTPSAVTNPPVGAFVPFRYKSPLHNSPGVGHVAFPGIPSPRKRESSKRKTKGRGKQLSGSIFFFLAPRSYACDSHSLVNPIYGGERGPQRPQTDTAMKNFHGVN